VSEVAGGPLDLQEHEEMVECRGLSVGGAWKLPYQKSLLQSIPDSSPLMEKLCKPVAETLQNMQVWEVQSCRLASW